jgi:hypothetical protein
LIKPGNSRLAPHFSDGGHSSSSLVRSSFSAYGERVLTRPQITPSLAIFLGVIVAIGAAVGHLWNGAGIALFVLALVAIDAKPSWKRIFNTARTGGDTDGVFASAWHRKAGTDSKPHGRH